MTTIKELSNMQGRRALITGAAGNLGRIMSETLAELGADLLMVDRAGSPFQKMATDLQTQWGVEVLFRECDLEQQSQRSELIRWIKDDERGLNVLVNNAAFVGTSDLQGWGVPFEDQSVETWRRALEVNLTAAFDLCQQLAPLLRSARGGSIMNVASIYGEHGPDWSLYEGTGMANVAAYGASKGGLIQLTRWLATTLAPHIRVNAISPGGIFRNQPEAFVKRYEAKTPMKRMATEDDFRGIVAYLASDLSSYVTGQKFAVDGGWGVW